MLIALIYKRFISLSSFTGYIIYPKLEDAIPLIMLNLLSAHGPLMSLPLSVLSIGIIWYRKRLHFELGYVSNT